MSCRRGDHNQASSSESNAVPSNARLPTALHVAVILSKLAGCASLRYVRIHLF